MTKTKRFYRCAKRAKGPSPRPITPSEALQILQSAVSYCQLAGLKVAAANSDNGTLAILIPNAHYVSNGTSAEFRLGTVMAHQDPSAQLVNAGTSHVA